MSIKVGDRVILRNGGLYVPSIVTRVHPITEDDKIEKVDLVTFEGDPGMAYPYQDVPYSANDDDPKPTWCEK